MSQICIDLSEYEKNYIQLCGQIEVVGLSFSDA